MTDLNKFYYVSSITTFNVRPSPDIMIDYAICNAEILRRSVTVFIIITATGPSPASFFTREIIQ